MPKCTWLVGTAILLTVACGCASSNRIVGHNMTEVGDWYGELGISGDLNEVTVLHGSRVRKLSILGDGNTVRVEEGVTLPKVEIWGGRNTVFVPQYLLVRVSQVGNANQVVRYPPGTDLNRLTPETYFTAPAPTSPPPERMDIDVRAAEPGAPPAAGGMGAESREMQPVEPAPMESSGAPPPERNPWITYEGEPPPG